MTKPKQFQSKEKSGKPDPKSIQVAAITLGCPKNQVDTETLLGRMTLSGLTYTDDPARADWIIVNTCAFIQSAEQETIQTILEAAKLKGKNARKRLIVAGCIVKKYGPEKLRQLFPEIDLAVLPSELNHANTWQQPWIPELNHDDHRQVAKRVVLSGPGTAFLKIAEGCSRACAFCLIPGLRGAFCSKSRTAILAEAEALTRQGAGELVVVAQDTASYGRDLKPAGSLVALLDQLVKVPKLRWLRLMYINPDSVNDDLIKRIRDERKICKYLDMPVQHASLDVLKRMQRNGNGEQWIKMIKKIRSQIPTIAIRTTLLTGFPGETEDDHRYLKTFITEARFDRLGVFTYSKEEGTRAAAMNHQVHGATKLRRQRELMAIQAPISQERLNRHIGQQAVCLVEEPSGKRHVLGRTMWDAPEIDGAIIIKGAAQPGQFVQARITGATVHDLYGEII